MKTAVEIKKALSICAKDDKCDGCPYLKGKYRCDNVKMLKDTLKLIEQLEAGNKV